MYRARRSETNEELIRSHELTIKTLQNLQRKIREDAYFNYNKINANYIYKYSKGNINTFYEELKERKPKLIEFLYLINLYGTQIHNYKNKLNSLKQKLKKMNYDN